MKRCKPTLLMTSVGGTMAPASILELRRRFKPELRIVGTSGTPAPVAEKLVDVFARVPMGTSDDYITKLLGVVEAEDVDVVLPWSDEEAVKVAATFEKFWACGAVPIVSSNECLQLISNKRATYEKLRESGISVPEYCVVDSPEELKKAIASYGYPNRTVVVKAPAGRGGRNLHVLCGQDDPPEWLGSGSREKRHEPGASFEMHELMEGEAMVMPRLFAPVYDVDVYAVNGDVRASSIRVRTNPTGIPFEGNMLVENPQIREFCKTVARILNLNSLHDMDIMSDPAGEPRLLEVNPRPSGSLVASLVAGIPLLQMAISDALGISHDYSAEDRQCEVLVYLNAVAVNNAQ